jgi:hypothetical protein
MLGDDALGGPSSFCKISDSAGLNEDVMYSQEDDGAISVADAS